MNRPTRRNRPTNASTKPKGVEPLPDRPAGEMPRVMVTFEPCHPPRVRHWWIFENMVLAADADCEDGGTVQVLDSRGRFLGSAVWNSKSRIRARIFSLERAVFDARYVAGAVEDGLERRRPWPAREGGFRLLFGDADGVPGLIADWLGGVLVVQVLGLAADAHADTALDVWRRVLAPRGVVVHRDAPVRELEGLPVAAEPEVTGEVVPQLHVRQAGGITLVADAVGGQKTGLFLDQQFNRALITPYASRARVLDLFCHVGGWAISAAAAGAMVAVGVDSSAAALELAAAGARASGVHERVRFERADVFEYLDAAVGRKETWDVVVSDPPAFAKAHRHKPEALKGYLSLHYRALRAVRPGGILVACSCSQVVDRQEFEDSLEQAARNARVRLHVLARGGQPSDHPAILGFPETDYLKCVVVRVLAE